MSLKIITIRYQRSPILRYKVGTDAINLTGVNILIINDKGEVLLQKRGTFPYKWVLIGGITEIGESLENTDTAVSETKEETNLHIEYLTFIGTTSGKDCYIEFPSGDKAYFISIGYYTKTYSGELKIDNVETKELRFFSYEELPENIPKSHKKMLDKYYLR